MLDARSSPEGEERLTGCVSQSTSRAPGSLAADSSGCSAASLLPCFDHRPRDLLETSASSIHILQSTSLTAKQ